jgi:hypothetical protein
VGRTIGAGLKYVPLIVAGCLRGGFVLVEQAAEPEDELAA